MRVYVFGRETTKVKFHLVLSYQGCTLSIWPLISTLVSWLDTFASFSAAKLLSPNPLSILYFLEESHYAKPTLRVGSYVLSLRIEYVHTLFVIFLHGRLKVLLLWRRRVSLIYPWLTWEAYQHLNIIIYLILLKFCHDRRSKNEGLWYPAVVVTWIT